jgi:RNA polymerase sigma-70 factor (ECF subfamily)
MIEAAPLDQKSARTPQVDNRSAGLPIGNRDTSELLYRRYCEQLVAIVKCRLPLDLAARIEAEDIVQSVFRRFIAHYENGGYVVPEGSELWSLLFVMALNKIREECSYHRAARRSTRRVSAVDPVDVAGDSGEWNSLHLQMAIDELLSPLSADRRAAVELRLAGHDVAGIADRVGRSKRTIERYLQDFRSRVEGALLDQPT